MLKQQAKFLNLLTKWVDIFVVFFSLVLAYYIWSEFQPNLFPLQNYLWVMFVVIPVWFYFFNFYGLYNSLRQWSVFDIVSRLVNVHLFGGLLSASVIYFVDRDRYSRGLYLGFLCISFLLLSLEKIGLRLVLGFYRHQGFNTRNLLIVGTVEKFRRFHGLIEDHADWGFQVLGFVQAEEPVSETEIDGHRVLGSIQDLLPICKANSVDEVVFCLPKNLVMDAETFCQDLQEMGVTVRMLLDFYDIPRCKTDISFFHTLPILTFHTKSLDAQQLFLKRAMDILGALCGLAVLTLVFPVVALAIKLDSSGPVFFGQDRVGENGRTFKLWKFRSMHVDAEARKKDLMEKNEMNGAIFKMKNDPRITRVGKFLRKTSLDELPQFWNVLRGEMSLVGTRPPTPEEVQQYENWHRRRISIKPGITGIWQTSGRNRVKDFDEIVRYDLQYIDTWSLWLDIRILFKTIAVVLGRSGSY